MIVKREPTMGQNIHYIIVALIWGMIIYGIGLSSTLLLSPRWSLLVMFSCGAAFLWGLDMFHKQIFEDTPLNVSNTTDQLRIRDGKLILASGVAMEPYLTSFYHFAELDDDTPVTIMRLDTANNIIKQALAKSIDSMANTEEIPHHPV